MASSGDNDRTKKRKMTEPCDKPNPRCGRGHTAAGSSSVAARGDARDRGRRDQLI